MIDVRFSLFRHYQETWQTIEKKDKSMTIVGVAVLPSGSLEVLDGSGSLYGWAPSSLAVEEGTLTGKWEVRIQVPVLKHVSVGRTGAVWGVAADGQVFTVRIVGSGLLIQSLTLCLSCAGMPVQY